MESRVSDEPTYLHYLKPPIIKTTNLTLTSEKFPLEKYASDIYKLTSTLGKSSFNRIELASLFRKSIELLYTKNSLLNSQKEKAEFTIDDFKHAANELKFLDNEKWDVRLLFYFIAINPLYTQDELIWDIKNHLAKLRTRNKYASEMKKYLEVEDEHIINAILMDAGNIQCFFRCSEYEDANEDFEEDKNIKKNDKKISIRLSFFLMNISITPPAPKSGSKSPLTIFSYDYRKAALTLKVIDQCLKENYDEQRLFNESIELIIEIKNLEQRKNSLGKYSIGNLPTLMPSPTPTQPNYIRTDSSCEDEFSTPTLGGAPHL